MIPSVNGVSFADYNQAILNGNRQHIRITFSGRTLTEDNVYSDGITYTEILNSDTDLIIGKAVCSTVSIPLVNDGSFTDFDFTRQFTVELGVEVEGVAQYSPLGVFIGEKPKRMMADTIDLVGYDLMTLFDKDADAFLASITYPTTIGGLFDSLCAHIGVTGDRTQAVGNTSVAIQNAPFDGNGITYKDILSWIAEACGCYARMGKTGTCELVWFNTANYSMNADVYFDIEPMEYSVPPIDCVSVQVTENDIGVSYPASGTFENQYAVVDNPFLYVTEASALATPVANLYNRLHWFMGNNVFDVNEAEFVNGRYINDSGEIKTNSSYQYTSNYISVEPNRKYDVRYVKTSTQSTGFLVSLYTSNKTFIKRVVAYGAASTSGLLKGSFETDDNVAYIRFNCGTKVDTSSIEIAVSKYTPCSVETDFGNWLIQCGDVITVIGLDDTETILMPIFSLTLKWATMATVHYENTGSEVREVATRQARNLIRQNYKYHEFEVDLDQLRSEIRTTTNRTFIQKEDPLTTGEEVKRGDYWFKPGFENWQEVLGDVGDYNIWDDIDEYDWGDLFSAVYCYDGTQWKLVVDFSIVAEQSSKIEQLDDRITAEVARANGAEGVLNASITVTAEAIDSEVSRAKQEEETLSSSIQQTAEDIRLGVKSVGKVETIGSYVLIERDKVEIDSDGSIVLKSGATFTVDSQNFSIDAQGNVVMNGRVTALDGKIGGWFIGTDYLGNKSTKSSSSVGLHALNDDDGEEDPASTYIIWAGNTSQSNANFAVLGDGTVRIRKGTLAIGGTSEAPNFSVESDGTVTIKKGSLTIGSNFEVTSNGELTAKSGKIGSDSTGYWHIGSKSIWNGVSALDGNTEGVYVGTDGIFLYKDASHNIKLQRSTGVLTVKGGKTGINVASANQSNGIYIGSEGIALGKTGTESTGFSDAFSVTNEGVLTAKSGTIGGWTIGAKSIWNGVDTFGTATAGTYVGTDGIWIYKDASHNIKLQQSTGYLTVVGGKKGIGLASASQTTGVYMGSDGIAIGRYGTSTSNYKDAFSVTSAGFLTARSGEIGGWTIGANSIWNGASALDQTNAGTYVGTDGIWIYKDASHNIKLQQSTGILTAKGGKTGIGVASANQTNGVYIGSDGIALGKTGNDTDGYSDAFSVTNNGVLTAKSGEIGGWTIGAKSIWNGVDTLGTATAGTYVGTDGIWIYKDASHNIKLQQSTGYLTVLGGKTGIGVASASQTNGVYIGSDGIALGKTGDSTNGYFDAFSVTSNGVLTAKSGTIGGWTIGSKSIWNGVDTFGTATAGTYVGTDGIWIYKDASHNIKLQQSTGYLTVVGGKKGIGIASASQTTGVYIGSNGIALGRYGTSTSNYKDAFSVTNAGFLTARSGEIGGWTIGAKSIWNGVDTLGTATAGTYVGTDGIWIYKDASHSIKLQQSTGVLTVIGGKTGIGVASADQTNGVYIGSDGIALGKTGNSTDGYSDAFSVTSSGVLTAKSGTIGGWTIGSKSIWNGVDTLGTATAGTYVGTDGIWIYKDASHNIKLQQSTGYLTVVGGKTGIGVASANQTNGVYMGSDGIALGKTGNATDGYSDAFSVTSSGVLTAKSGEIGGWTIGANSLFNDTDSVTSTTEGIFLGTTGIRVYKDESHNFTVLKSNGHMTVMGGMTGVDDTTNSTGMYIGSDGIALGGGNFVVTSVGALTAKSGTIGTGTTPWKIGTQSIFNGTSSMTSTTKGIFLGTTGIRLYNTSLKYVSIPSNCNFVLRAGMNAVTDTTHTTGAYLGYDGIALGGGKFKVTTAGELTAKSGTIGSGTNVWHIGSEGIYNGTTGISDTNPGAYLGTDGIRIYYDSTHLFNVIASSGRTIIQSGMTGIDDTTNNGAFLDTSSGIALGGGKFIVTTGGVLTAKKGTVGGWTLGDNYFGNGATKNESTIGLYSNATGNNYMFWAGDSVDHTTTWAINTTKTWGDLNTGYWDSLRNKPPFYLCANGYMHARAGDIGGWTISDTALKSSKTGMAITRSDSDVAFWAGSATPSSANFQVTQNGDVTMRSGSIRLGGTASSPNFQVTSDGNVAIRSGSIRLGGSSSSPNFQVTSDGDVTIKKGDLTITRGSIALGNKFLVTSDGVLTARSGTIGGWNFDAHHMWGGEGTNTVALSSSGTYRIYAGQPYATASEAQSAGVVQATDAPFRVTSDGKVYVTKLYSVDVSDPQSPVEKEINLNQNGYKIGSGYKTVKKVENGKITFSDGTTFSKATSMSPSVVGSTIKVTAKNGSTSLDSPTPIIIGFGEYQDHDMDLALYADGSPTQIEGSTRCKFPIACGKINGGSTNPTKITTKEIIFNLSSFLTTGSYSTVGTKTPPDGYIGFSSVTFSLSKSNVTSFTKNDTNYSTSGSIEVGSISKSGLSGNTYIHWNCAGKKWHIVVNT